MLSPAVEISSSKRETQATGLGSSDISSSSLWLSTMSFLSSTVTPFSGSFVFLGMFAALWIMCVSAGEILSASLLLDSGFFLSNSYFCSGLMALALHILRAFAFASSSAALMKASSPSSLGSSFNGVGDELLDLLPSLPVVALPCPCFLFALACARLANLL